jgi:uncharacterized protein YfaS (alpha-2-macroglobulin family)
MLHTEGDKAELCLEFDHPLDAGSRARTALRLEADGKNISLAPQSLSITSTFLCLPQLDYGKDYHLTLSRLRGSKGEGLRESYDVSFTVIDRHPSLSFTGDNMSDGLLRWGDTAPALHGVNVAQAHVELYRLTEPDDLAKAWLERQQTALAPSESAYFARGKGKLVWQGDVTFDESPNKDVNVNLPLPTDENTAPGLYFLVASAPNIKIKPSEKGLAPLAAAWLLRSNLRMLAAHDADGVHVLVSTKDAPARDIHVTILDQDRHVLAEGKPDADGITDLPLPENKQDAAALIVGQSAAGDVAFIDAHGSENDHPVLPALEALISTARPFYAPGAVVDATLTARDIHGHAVNSAGGGSLQISRTDGSLYARASVPAAESGIAHVSIPAPATNGVWPLIWQSADGTTFAEGIFRVTPNPTAPRLTLDADRAMLSGDNDVSLKITSLTNADTPEPYIAGRITAGWTTPTHVFPGWEDYQFGGGENETVPPAPVASFITDAEGKAQIHLNLKAPPTVSSLRAAVINVIADPASGAADPAPLLLPSSPAGIIVGVKPLADRGRFAENSRARFALVALDTEGRRFDADNLAFQIYDEGRSFEWYQADGRWDYKPLQQSRRMGGKPLSLKAQGDNIIEWPVTAGSYRLDITDLNSDVLARTYFSAGWGTPKVIAVAPARLELIADTNGLHVGEAAHVRFKLPAPAMIGVFIADDRIRKIIHRLGVKGVNDIAFTPAKDWGDHIRVHIDAGDTDGEITLPVAASTAKITTTTGSSSLPALDVTEWMPPVLTAGDVLEASLEIENNNAPSGTYKYAFSAAGVKVSDATGTLTLAPGQAKNIVFTLRAPVAGTWPLKLEITGPHGFHLSREWSVDVHAQPQSLNKVTGYKLDPEQSWPTGAKPQTRHGPGFLFVAAEPLLNAPLILEMALRARPIVTVALVGRLEMLRLWHNEIVSAGLLSEQNFAALQDETLLRLLQRQETDGSFPVMPSGDSDLVSTAAALMALVHVAQPKAQPAVEIAKDWLKRKLENTWFDEHERPERAAVYAMLALADGADAGSLHYFSDTSADKPLPSAAAVQLAAALARVNDHDKAMLWLGRAGIEKNAADIDPDLLPYLAENAFFDPHDLAAAMQATAAKIAADPANDALAVPFLRSLAVLERRAGGWRITINGSVKNADGILVLPMTDKAPVLANPNNDPVYIEDAAFGTAPSETKIAGITHRVYRLDGGEASESSFHRGEIYIVVLEGAWPNDDAENILVLDDPGPALASLGCMLDGTSETGGALGWIKTLALTPLVVCEKPERSLFALIARKDKNAKSWRVAYLATAIEDGSFDRTPARAYLENEEVAEENVKGPVRIRK